MENLFVIANYYYNFGFNITHIGIDRRRFHKNLRTTYYHLDRILKAPTHTWNVFEYQRQTLEQLNSQDWRNASGLGVVLSYNNLRAIDIDECDDPSLIYKFLSNLKLPNNYEWVVKSGSGMGYHIIFYCEEHTFPTLDGKVKAFLPNNDYAKAFDHLELRWNGHLVLPPSVHPTYRKYAFLNVDFPSSKPLTISMTEVGKLLEQFCGTSVNEEYNVSMGYLDIDVVKYKNFDGLFQFNDDVKEIELENEPDDLGDIFEESGEIPLNSKDSGKYLDFHSTEIEPDTAKVRDDYQKPYFLVVDIETTGLIPDEVEEKSLKEYPNIVQIAWMVVDIKGKTLSERSYLIKPSSKPDPIDYSAYRKAGLLFESFQKLNNGDNIHGITQKDLLSFGVYIEDVLNKLQIIASKCDFLIGHNLEFDKKMIQMECQRLRRQNVFENLIEVCTMKASLEYCGIVDKRGFKWPKLTELYLKLFDQHIPEIHNARIDVKTTVKCFFELMNRGIVKLM